MQVCMLYRSILDLRQIFVDFSRFVCLFPREVILDQNFLLISTSFSKIIWKIALGPMTFIHLFCIFLSLGFITLIVANLALRCIINHLNWFKLLPKIQRRLRYLWGSSMISSNSFVFGEWGRTNILCNFSFQFRLHNLVSSWDLIF